MSTNATNPSIAPTFTVTQQTWDGNGAHHVTVVMSQATHTARDQRKARDLARRSVSRPELVKWSRLESTTMTEDLKIQFHFTVSRLDRQYR